MCPATGADTTLVRGLAQNLDEPCRRNSGSRVLGPPKTRSQNYSGFGEVEKNS